MSSPIEAHPQDPSATSLIQKRISGIIKDIASLQNWCHQSGAPEELVEQLCSPYEDILRTMFEEELPLAQLLERSDLVVALKGVAVNLKNPRVSLISSIFNDVREQVGAIAFALANIDGRQMLPKDVDLGLAAYARGSLYLGFSLPDPETPDEEGNVSLLGREEPLARATKEALRTLGVVSRNVESDHPQEALAREIPDPKVRDIALNAVQKLAPTGRRGIDSVQIGTGRLGSGDLARLTPATREHLRGLMQQPVISEEQTTVTGIVREIDLDAQRFELRRIAGSEVQGVRVVYSAEQVENAAGLPDKKVTVVGRVDRQKDGKPRLIQALTITLEG
jgi:hypothetical protein